MKLKMAVYIAENGVLQAPEATVVTCECSMTGVDAACDFATEYQTSASDLSKLGFLLALQW